MTGACPLRRARDRRQRGSTSTCPRIDGSRAWDPPLAFVMGGAISVAAVAFARAEHRTESALGAPMQLPNRRREIDAGLVLGSVAFGIGWGMAGFCPGPALVALGTGRGEAMIFVAAMILGMGIFELIDRRRTPSLAGGPRARPSTGLR